MAETAKSSRIRRIIYSNELLASGIVTPVLYDDDLDPYFNKNVLDPVLSANPNTSIREYEWSFNKSKQVEKPADAFDPATGYRALLTEDNRRMRGSLDSVGDYYAVAISTAEKTTGKHYIEARTIDSTASPIVGVVANGTTAINISQGSGTAHGFATVTQEILIAIDLDAGKMWYGNKSTSGYWLPGSDPVTQVNPKFSWTPNTPMRIFMRCWYNDYSYGDQAAEMRVNFGNNEFAVDPPDGYIPGWRK